MDHGESDTYCMNYLANYIIIPAAVILDPKTYIIYMYSTYMRCKCSLVYIRTYCKIAIIHKSMKRNV